MWASGEQGKLHLYLQSLPSAHITSWAPPPVRSVVALDSHRSTNPTVNCSCEGHAPYEFLVVWGAAEVVLALGSGCKYRLSLAERCDCTETIINPLLEDSYQNPISECKWQLSHIWRQAIKPSPLTQVHGKTVFHETSPWWQNGWEPLLCVTCKRSLQTNKKITVTQK